MYGESKSYFRRRFWFHQWRARRTEKFNIGKFNTREAAYAFLRQYGGEGFIKSQRVKEMKCFSFIKNLSLLISLQYGIIIRKYIFAYVILFVSDFFG